MMDVELQIAAYQAWLTVGLDRTKKLPPFKKLVEKMETKVVEKIDAELARQQHEELIAIMMKQSKKES